MASDHADVLIFGHDPAAALAAARLKADGFAVQHVAVGPPPADRLLLLDADAAALHAKLSPLPGRAITEVTLLGPRGVQSATWAAGEAAATITTAAGVNAALGASPRKVGKAEILRVDTAGVHVTLDGKPFSATLMLLADDVPPSAERALNLSPITAGFKLHVMAVQPPARPALPLMPEVGGMVDAWAMVLSDGKRAELQLLLPAALAPAAPLADAMARLPLKRVGRAGPTVLPLRVAGAMEQENVGDRTLCIGPAGGFVNTLGQGVWAGMVSADQAAGVLGNALKTDHPQDALTHFARAWSAALGHRLRGPQQNLRLLLPLVYRGGPLVEVPDAQG